MQRYFLGENKKVDEHIYLVNEDYHHIVNVMRMVIGDKISVVFPNGEVAVSEITNIEKDFVEAKIVTWQEERKELPIHVTIGSSLLKGDKFDWVVQKSTELGVAKIIPFSSERSIVKLDRKKGEKRVERWRKIAKEAAEQSERLIIPQIEEPVMLNELVNNMKNTTFTKKLIAYEENARANESSQFFTTLQELNHGDSLLILFGPEGGFSSNEIDLLKEYSFIPCGLGPRIMRAETAPLYSLSAISFYFELMR